mmetsp:Transcript_43096/g.129426  ORF Transcript_43096/g.129426 Transcript_43096/m.129426 type:complete len:300 (-) Transcript_43096:147-1046(-)
MERSHKKFQRDVRHWRADVRPSIVPHKRSHKVHTDPPHQPHKCSRHGYSSDTPVARLCVNSRHSILPHNNSLDHVDIASVATQQLHNHPKGQANPLIRERVHGTDVAGTGCGTGISRRSPMSSADTSAPAGSVPAALGSSSSAFAERADRSRLLACPPVLTAHQRCCCAASPGTQGQPDGGCPKWSVARWYSGRSGSSASGCASATSTRRGSGSAAPRIARSAGATTRWKHANDETGLPGSAKTDTRRGAHPSARGGASRVAYVSGFPGFMSTRPKCTLPERSSSGLMRSRSPIDTPPF